ncbi:hypothetical protein C8R46DRAFT_1040678 [Mycena filopes]|nr:hypothetical protein C8R46DRAFT_1040678 [Mycena filopes]
MAAAGDLSTTRRRIKAFVSAVCPSLRLGLFAVPSTGTAVILTGVERVFQKLPRGGTGNGTAVAGGGTIEGTTRHPVDGRRSTVKNGRYPSRCRAVASKQKNVTERVGYPSHGTRRTAATGTVNSPTCVPSFLSLYVAIGFDSLPKSKSKCGEVLAQTYSVYVHQGDWGVCPAMLGPTEFLDVQRVFRSADMNRATFRISHITCLHQVVTEDGSNRGSLRPASNGVFEHIASGPPPATS